MAILNITQTGYLGLHDHEEKLVIQQMMASIWLQSLRRADFFQLPETRERFLRIVDSFILAGRHLSNAQFDFLKKMSGASCSLEFEDISSIDAATRRALRTYGKSSVIDKPKSRRALISSVLNQQQLADLFAACSSSGATTASTFTNQTSKTSMTASPKPTATTTAPSNENRGPEPVGNEGRFISKAEFENTVGDIRKQLDEILRAVTTGSRANNPGIVSAIPPERITALPTTRHQTPAGPAALHRTPAGPATPTATAPNRSAILQEPPTKDERKRELIEWMTKQLGAA